MFEWFKRFAASPSHDVSTMSTEFGRMLDAGRHIFLTAANALLGGTDPEVIRAELFATDEQINESEQRIRRELVVHGSVHGPTTLPATLILMSVVKDAERIGDYAKNLFDLTVQAPPLARDAFHADLVELKNKVAEHLRATRKVFDSQNDGEARRLSHELSETEDHCDRRVKEILSSQNDTGSPATLVLVYRYFKRVVSHCLNVTTSVFMPLDKIDYYDETPRPPLPPVD